MRLTVKLVIWLFICVVLAVGINGLYGVRGELARYESDIATRHVVMGRMLRAAFVEVMDTDGEARALSVLDYTDRRVPVDIRWVHLEPGVPASRKPFAPLDRLTPLALDRDVHHKDGSRLRTYVPVHIEGRPLSALEFSESLEGEREVVRRAVQRELRSVTAVAIAIGIAATILGALLVARPMRQLVLHARRIGQGDLSPMRAPKGKDEIAQLGREMNAMCDRLADAQATKLKALDQLRHAERLNTVGKLASGLAHELGTPLNVITLRAKSVANGRATGDRAREAGRSIAEQATRVTNLVRRLLDFARRSAPQRDAVDIDELATRTADLLEPVAAKAKVKFEIARSRADETTVRGDAEQLQQVLTNLMMNGIQAMREGGTIAIASKIETATPPADHGGQRARYLQISIRDRGEGIPDDVLPHLFEPFFTTKEIGEGTGLGLAVCYGIVRDHGGWIDVASVPGEGATFTLFLPVEERATA